MRVYLEEIGPSSTISSADKDLRVSTMKETRIYSDSGILLVDSDGLRRLSITDGPVRSLSIGGKSATVDTSTYEWSDIEYQIPIPCMEVEIARTKYSLTQKSPTKFIVESVEGKCTECYFETDQDTALLANDITTLMSRLKFC